MASGTRRRNVLKRLAWHAATTGVGYALLLRGATSEHQRTSLRVKRYFRANDHASTFTCMQHEVDGDGLLDLLKQHVLAGGCPPATRTLRPDGLELLVCPQHEVDVVCEHFECPLWSHLTGRFAHARVARAAHFGMRHPAPVTVEFPAGRYWSQLTPRVAETIVWREGDVHAAGCYLGWAGLDEWGQALDRELFRREGWGWLDVPRRSRIVWRNVRAALTRLEFVRNDGTRGVHLARVAVSREAHGTANSLRSYHVTTLHTA